MCLLVGGERRKGEKERGEREEKRRDSFIDTSRLARVVHPATFPNVNLNRLKVWLTPELGRFYCSCD